MESKAGDNRRQEIITELSNAIANKDYGKAAAILQILLEYNPNEPALLVELARCQLGLGKPLAALLTLKKGKIDSFEEREFFFLLGPIYEALYLNELAIEVARRIIAGGWRSEEVYTSLAKLLFAHKCEKEAVEAAKEGLKAFPKSDNLKYVLGITYLYLKDKQNALITSKEMEKSGAPLASSLAKLIEKDDPGVDKKETIRAKQEAKDHYLKAYQVLKNGENELAIEQLIKALHLDSDLAEAYTRLGCIYDSYGLLDEGLTLHKKAIEIDPQLAEAYSNMGYVYQIKGDVQRALDVYTKALEIDPNLVQAHNSLGYLYDTIGSYEKGLQHFKLALKIDPQRETTWRNIAHAYRKLGNTDEAIAAYRTLIKIDPRSQCRIGLAQIYEELGRYGEAKAELLEFTKREPASLTGWLELAICHIKLGEEKDLRNAIDKVMTLPAKEPGDLFTKATLMENIDKNVAFECWRDFLSRAERLNPQSDEISYAKKRIAELGKHMQ